MFCNAVISGVTCGGDSFTIIRVFRGKRYSGGIWKESQTCDTREIVCRTCSTRYLTETEMTYMFKFDTERLRSKKVSIKTDKNQLALL
jgi:hypothetical protein